MAFDHLHAQIRPNMQAWDLKDVENFSVNDAHCEMQKQALGISTRLEKIVVVVYKARLNFIISGAFGTTVLNYLNGRTGMIQRSSIIHYTFNYVTQTKK